MNKLSQTYNMYKKPILIVDIDETLIHSVANDTPGDFTIQLAGDPVRY